MMKKTTKTLVFAALVIAAAYFVFAGGISIPGVGTGEQQFKYTCTVTIDNLPLVSPWINEGRTSCIKESVGSCFFTNALSIFGEVGKIKACIGNECKSTNYDVGNIIGNRVSKGITLCGSDVDKVKVYLYDDSNVLKDSFEVVV